MPYSGRRAPRRQADWDREQAIITYCWGPACNGATKAAATLAHLGFRVKEMLGGMEYWRLEGGALAGTLKEHAPLHWRMPDRIRSIHANDTIV